MARIRRTIRYVGSLFSAYIHDPLENGDNSAYTVVLDAVCHSALTTLTFLYVDEYVLTNSIAIFFRGVKFVSNNRTERHRNRLCSIV